MQQLLRNRVAISLVAAVSLAGLYLHWAALTTLRNTYYLGGWFLFILIFILAFHDPRKPGKRVLSNGESRWRPSHAWLGILSAVFYFLHTGLRFPQGVFERLLAALFLTVAISGMVGIRYAAKLDDDTLETVAESQEIPTWLSFHVPLTYALILSSIVHGILAHAHGWLAWAILGKGR